jgi:hypothetical protein
VPAVRVRELASTAASGAHTTDIFDYADQGQAIDDLRNGRVNGVLTIPTDFSRRVLARNDPHVALIEDNTDGFVSVAMAGTMGGILQAYSLPSHTPRIAGAAALDVVEIYPYVVRAYSAGIGRHVDLHDGDDRRWDHLHRRQGARLHEDIS